MMTIIIVSWVSLSILFILALLGAAARPMPRRDQELTPEKEAIRPSKPLPRPARLAASAPTA